MSLYFAIINNAPNLNFGADSLSIDAWIKLPAPGTGFMPIVDKRIAGPTDAPYGYVFYVSDGHLGFAMSNDINVSPHAGIGAEDTANNLADNDWHHVAVTVQRNPASATGGNLFINGATIPTATFSTIPFVNLMADNSADLILGSTNRLGRGPVSAFFNGWIDEVEIFNRALAQTEIQAIYRAGSAGKCKCLLVSNEKINCNPHGTSTYTFTLTNLSNSTASGVAISPSSPPNVTITPGPIAGFPLLPGASTTVTVTIGGTGAVAGANICFTVALVAPGAAICRTDQCITLPRCRPSRHLSFR